MFKKLYREANDEIPVNTELMQELKQRASEGKRRPFAFIYRYGAAVAAAALVAVFLNVKPYINHDFINDSAYTDGDTQTDTDAETEDNTASEPEITISEEAPQAEADVKFQTEAVKSPKNSASVKKNTAKTGQKPADNPAADNPEVREAKTEAEPVKSAGTQNHNNTQEIKGTEDIKETAEGSRISASENSKSTGAVKSQRNIPSYDNASDEAISMPAIFPSSGDYSAAGGGAAPTAERSKDAAPMAASARTHNDSGFDAESAALPEGMNLVSDSGDKDRVLIYSDGNRRVKLKVNDNPDTVKAKIKQSDGKNYGSNCVIREINSSSYEAYIATEQGISVNTDGLSKDELCDLIDSIEG